AATAVDARGQRGEIGQGHAPEPIRDRVVAFPCMEHGARLTTARTIVLWLLLLTLPALAAAQDEGSRVSVQGALGTNANVGGNTQALSVGFAITDRLDVLVSAERIHLPSEVTYHDHGVSATRGGTTTFVSGEIQVVPVRTARVSPYALAGAGA